MTWWADEADEEAGQEKEEGDEQTSGRQRGLIGERGRGGDGVEERFNHGAEGRGLA